MTDDFKFTIESYHTAKPVLGMCKQSAVWGVEKQRASIAPLIYFKRPKWIKDDDIWNKIVDSVELNLPAGFEIK